MRLILGDQLSTQISSLKGINKEKDKILMCEIQQEAEYVKHHKKKIAFIFSAMRHFASDLKTKGYAVMYIKLDDPLNTGSFLGEIKKCVERQGIEKIVVTHPGEYRLLTEIESWSSRLRLPVEIKEDDRFLCSLSDFKEWSKGRGQVRMEYFYREMRKKYQILMQGDLPVGGQWNYDRDNRKPYKALTSFPEYTMFSQDEMTQEVLALVETHFSGHFGDLLPFHFAVTKEQAEKVLEEFIKNRLVFFGDYQDVMIDGQPWLYHSHISFYLNVGLLLPLECIKSAEQAFKNGFAPLNAVEGFIRQILGWREYVRGIYWLKMPEYQQENFLNAQQKLPSLYWTGDTKMNCLKACVDQTKVYAYAHHIQRLMVLGNFALLLGVHPEQLNHWFLLVYADAYEWVELPNVSGMILFADGGYLASKPYAAGGAYIDRMSNYCKGCKYQVSEKVGKNACPFNYLYWDFLVRHESKLSRNPRLAMMYRLYDKMSNEMKMRIRQSSQDFLNELYVF